jgi:PD-(D/E)XK nuclease superfamily
VKKTKMTPRVMEMTRVFAQDEERDVPSTPAPQEAPRKLLVPSMSKSDLLLTCQWPWGRMAPPEEVGEEARFGSAFHEVMANTRVDDAPQAKRAAKKWGVDAKALEERFRPARKLLKEFLAGDNPWGVKFTKVFYEQSYAINPRMGEARLIEGPREEDHVYPDVQDGEIPGTADVVAISADQRTILVLDHKTGFDIPLVQGAGQLLSLMLAVSRVAAFENEQGHGPPIKRRCIAFLQAQAGVPPVILADTVSEEELINHRMRLAKAQARIGDGSLVPGEHCRYCPAFMICPTQTSSLVALKKNGPLTSERVGEIHQALGEYAHLKERLGEMIHGWVKQHGAVTRPDGKVLAFISRPYSNLSQASIRRALPTKEAEALINKLRANGCIEEGEREELRAVKE